MKKLAIVLILFLVGCIPTTQQIRGLGNDVDKLMVAVDGYQESVSEEIDRIQEHIKAVNETLKKTDGLIEAFEAGIESSKPFNPYADEMSAILALVSAGVILFAKKKTNEVGILKNKYQAFKEGTETFKLENPDKAAELYANIGSARK